MAGHTISLYLKEHGHQVYGFDLNESRYIDSFACNAFDSETLLKVVRDGEYDTIINCIGILNQFAEQHKDLAAYLNSYFPHFLAMATEGTRTQVIQMSTDCVFSGKRGCYAEDDFKDGETFYDRSKALGELQDNKNLTLRTSIVGPDINPAGIGLLNWFLRQKGQINGFTKAIWTGVTTLQLARIMEQASIQRASGLYNVVPGSSISKYELCKLFNHYFRNDSLTINPVEGVNADKSLIRTRFDFDFRVPDYDSMISELASWMKAHREMYPHYCL